MHDLPPKRTAIAFRILQAHPCTCLHAAWGHPRVALQPCCWDQRVGPPQRPWGPISGPSSAHMRHPGCSKLSHSQVGAPPPSETAGLPCQVCCLACSLPPGHCRPDKQSNSVLRKSSCNEISRGHDFTALNSYIQHLSCIYKVISTQVTTTGYTLISTLSVNLSLKELHILYKQLFSVLTLKTIPLKHLSFITTQMCFHNSIRLYNTS